MPNESKPATSWKIGHVEDHPMTVQGLRNLLEDEPDLEWVGAADTVAALVASHPDVQVVVLDLRLPDGSSPKDNVEGLNELGIAALIYTSGEHPDLLRSAARAGVLGTVMKYEPNLVVVAAIRSVAQGHPVLSAEWAAAIASDPDIQRIDLTPHMRDVLTRYAMGSSAAVIGTQLNLASSTVTEYLNRIKRKYAEAGRPAPNKTQLVHRAIEDGLLQIQQDGRLGG